MSLPRIVLLNVKGVFDTSLHPGKSRAILSLLRSLSPDYAFLTETHISPDLNPYPYLPMSSSPAVSDPWSGVAVIPLSPSAYIHSSSSLSDGRHLNVVLRCPNGSPSSFSLFYAPPARPARLPFFHDTLDPGADVILGDWNNTLALTDRTSPRPNHPDEDFLLSWLATHTLTDCDPDGKHTFKSNKGNTARLDRIYSRNRPRYSVSVIPVPLSDHSLILATPTSPPQHLSTRRSINLRFVDLSSPGTLDLLNHRLAQYLHLTDGEVHAKWDTIKKQIFNTVKSTSSFSETRVQRAMRELTLASSLPPDHPEVSAIQKKLSDALNDERDYLAARARISADAARELPTKFLSRLIHSQSTRDIITSITTDDSQVSDNTSIIQAFHAYYSTLYDSAPITSTPLLKHTLTLSKRIRSTLATPPTPADLLIPIMKKRKKAPGPDGIPMEVYILVPITLLLLTKVIRHVWSTGNTPLSWRTSYTKLIPKEGKDRKNVANYRGIALCNTDYKVFAAYPAAIVQTDPPFPENQTGGVRGRSPYTAIIRVSTHLINSENATPLLVDFEKAYDKVNRDWLQTVLNEAGFPTLLTKAIMDIQRNSVTSLIINGQLSPPIYKRGGIGQGDPFSSLFFDLSIQPLINYLTSQNIFTHGHVDDIITAPNSPTQLSITLEAFNLYERQTGAKVNISKSTIMLRDHDTSSHHIIPSTREPQRYLGFLLHSDGQVGILPDTTQRILMILSSAKNLHLSLAGKQSILVSYTRPIYLFAATTATINNTRDITNIENWFLSSDPSAYDPTYTYPTHTAPEKMDHPITRLRTTSLPTTLTLRQANLYIKTFYPPQSLRLPTPALNNIPTPTSTLHDILLNAWKDLLPSLFFVTKRVTSHDIENARGKYRKIQPELNKLHPILTHRTNPKQQYERTKSQSPINLSKGQERIAEKYATQFTSLYKAIKSPTFRSPIQSFLWLLISRKLWLDKPHPHLCPLCLKTKASTTHIFQECQTILNLEITPLISLFTPPHTPETITIPALQLWGIWKIVNALILDHAAKLFEPTKIATHLTSIIQSEEERIKLKFKSCLQVRN